MSTATETLDRTPDTGTCASGAQASTLVAALLGFFVVTLDAVIVNVALPAVRSDLGGGVGGLQWVVDGYTVAFAALLLSAGALTDRVGAKTAFATGLTLFGLASIACGLTPTIGALLVFRALQGASAAALMPASMALVGHAFPEPRARARAVAIWAMGGAIASSTAPVLGGALTLVSWRLIFLVNVPVVLAALYLLRTTPASPRHTHPFDLPGQVTGVVAMVALTFAVIEAGSAGLADPVVLVAAAVALLSGAAFVRAETHSAHPMVPLQLVRSHAVLTPVVVGFAFMVGYYGLPFVESLFLQQQRGLTALETGLVFLPMMLIGLFITPYAPRIADRIGRRALVVTGLLLMTLGLVALAAAPTNAPLVVIAALMALVGLAGPTVAPAITAVLLNGVDPHQSGTASGVLNTSRQVGGALAVAIFGSLLSGPAGFHTGMVISLLIAAAVALIAAAVAGLRLPTTH